MRMWLIGGVESEGWKYVHSKHAIFSPVALRSLCNEHAIPQINNNMRYCVLK